jgi:hypothetical protein
MRMVKPALQPPDPLARAGDALGRKKSTAFSSGSP